MKTMNSRLRKAGIESLTILAAVFATCFTISAQGARFGGSLKENGELALIESNKATTVTSTKKEAAADMIYFAEFLKEESESELKVESWMTDAGNFGFTEMEAETEEALKVEDWMIKDLLLKAETPGTSKEEPVTAVPEKRAKSSGVTFPGAQFGRRAFIHIEMEDSKLELESWMVDARYWRVKK